MSKQSMIRIHGQDFVGASTTCFKILELMQDLQAVDIVYDFDAVAVTQNKLYYRTELECIQTAIEEFSAYENRDEAEKVRQEAIAQRELAEEAA